MILSLRTRLSLSNMLVALLCVLLVSALANGLLETSFRRYVRDGQERKARSVAAQMGAQHRTDGTWDQAGLAAVGMAALEQGMVVKLMDPAGATVWDATVHNGGLCAQMIDHMAVNMASRYPNWRGAYAENLYPVRAGFLAAGTAVVGTYGPFYLDDADLSFINSLNRLLLWATAGALAMAGGLGFLMARRISVPLARVAAATQRIAAGHRDVRIDGKTDVREIDGIAAAVNGLAAALREQESLRRRLTTDMAHELRTPLATLQSHLEALIDGVWEADQARLSGLHAEILRVNRLVADLENLACYENGSPALSCTDADLVALASGIVFNHEPQFRAAGLRLGFRAGIGEAFVSADADRLSQALINLLSNALKFTPAGGAVTVEVDASGGEGRVRVTDTGVGIEAADLPFVFERFYRADPSRNRATGGSGIGLAITKAIVEAHGGRVSAESKPGRGSTFTATLPLVR